MSKQFERGLQRIIEPHILSLRRIFTSDLHKPTFSVKQDRDVVARRLPLKKLIIVCH
jgi:hypothetical protein